MRGGASGSSSACVDAETLAAWADGALGASDAAAVETHLASCGRCQEMVAVFAKTEPVASPAPPPAAAPGPAPQPALAAAPPPPPPPPAPQFAPPPPPPAPFPSAPVRAIAPPAAPEPAATAEALQRTAVTELPRIVSEF